MRCNQMISNAIRFTLVMLVGMLAAYAGSVQAQDAMETLLQEQAVKVFLDVPFTYEEYIKQEATFVNYVRDRKQAEVHIMLTTQSTGAGGFENTITFSGLQRFLAVDDTLTVVTHQMDTEEQTRRSITNIIKLGLVRYVCETPLVNNLNVSFLGSNGRGGRSAQEQVVDNWNYWVFNINTNTRMSGEESSENLNLSGSFSADRVTPEWKVSASWSSSYNNREYNSEFYSYSTTTRRHNFRGLAVKSISDHWSIGGYAEVEKSTYNNIELSYSAAPAIEYNVFPYDESTFHEFRFLYRTDFTNMDYVEETIYEKWSEELISESLEATYEIKEPWGSVRTTVEGSHYFHDFEKRRFEVMCSLDVRLTEGLSVNLTGSYSKINDQLALKKGDVTQEELLTNQRALATSYDYSVSVGLRYSFGSIYSNVVNPRFGNMRGIRGGGGGSFGGFGF